MRYAPPEFTKQLAREYPNYRIRWSPVRHRWQLEEKVGRGIADFPIDPLHDSTVERRKNSYDDLIRVKDGYILWVEVAPGSITPCPTCGADMKAVHYEFTQVKCPSCTDKVVTGFFPLNESLLDVLRSTDPNRGGYDRFHPHKVRALNLRRQELINNANYREARALGVDDARVDIPKRGYTGKEHMWADAPAPKIVLTNPDQ
jgi:hypothetical protein